MAESDPTGAEAVRPARVAAVVWLAVAALVFAYGLQRLVFGYIVPGVWTSFAYYYGAGADLPAHPERIYDPAMAIIQEGFLYPPPCAALFRPLTWFSIRTAFTIFAVLSYLAAAWAAWVVLRLRQQHEPVDPWRAAACVALAVACGPTYMNASGGQVNAMVLALCVGAVALLERERPAAAGALLALGIWTKLYPIVLLLPVAVYSRHRRALLGAVVVGLLIPLALLPVVPAELYREYVQDILPCLSRATAHHATNQSLIAVLYRLTHGASSATVWSSVPIPPAFRLTAASLGFTAIVAATVWGRRERELPAYALVLAIIPMAIPLGWGYTYVTILPALVLALVTADRQPVTLRCLVAVAVLAVLPPSHMIVGFLDRGPAVPAHLFYARYLWAAIVLCAATVAGCGAASTIRPDGPGQVGRRRPS